MEICILRNFRLDATTRVLCILINMINDQDSLSNIDPDINLHQNNNNVCQCYTIEEFNDSVDKNLVCDLRLLKLNIQSFVANHDKLNVLLGSLNNPPEFLVLSETWNTASLLNTCFVDGFSGFRTIRTRCRGGGVLIFCSGTLKAKQIDELSLRSFPIDLAPNSILFGVKSIGKV